MAPQSFDLAAPVSGHVWLYRGKRRQTWCAKWRDHAGQHEKRLGRAWTGRDQPPPGFLRRREAEALLEEILVEARHGQLRLRRTGFTFADVAEDWYARGPLERDWSASTQRDYRSVLDTLEHSSIRVFEGYAAKKTGKPKSRKSRTVPMVDTLADSLNELKRREHHTARGDHVFVSRFGTRLDGSALRRRYIATRDAAGLRPLRFHDLRHYADGGVMRPAWLFGLVRALLVVILSA
jgi:integrase